MAGILKCTACTACTAAIWALVHCDKKKTGPYDGVSTLDQLLNDSGNPVHAHTQAKNDSGACTITRTLACTHICPHAHADKHMLTCTCTCASTHANTYTNARTAPVVLCALQHSNMGNTRWALALHLQGPTQSYAYRRGCTEPSPCRGPWV